MDIVQWILTPNWQHLSDFEGCKTQYDGSVNKAVLAATRKSKSVMDIGNLRSFLESQGISLTAPNTYMGTNDMYNAKTFYTGNSFPVASTFRYDEQFKPHRKREIFKALQQAGEIVLTPMFKVSCEYSDHVVVSGGTQVVRINNIALGTRNVPAPLTFWKCGASKPQSYIADSSTDGRFYRADAYHNYAQEWSFASAVHLRNPTLGLFFDQHSKPDFQSLTIALRKHDDYLTLLNSALDELHSGVYDVLTELGELPETVSYLFSILRRLVLLFVGLKSKEAAARTKFQGKELIDEISSLWMQFRYAASPLAYSVEDGLKLLNTKIVEYQSVRKRVDVPFKYEIGEYSFEGVMENRIFGKMRIDANARTVNLGLNPLKTLWELTPLSFVVDWVLPIGDMLGAIVAPTHAKQVATAGSLRVRKLKVTHSSGVDIPTSFNFYDIKPVAGATRPFPDVFFNWKRSLDSLALAWGLFLKQHWKS